MEKYGVENIKIIISYGMDWGNDLVKALADKKINLKDAPLFLSEIFKLPVVIKAAPKAKDEFLDFSDTEREEVKTWFAETYDCPSDKVEVLVEKALETAIDVSILVQDVLQLMEAIKNMRDGDND